MGGGYTFLNATFQSQEFVDGSANSTNDAENRGLEGSIQIQPGSRIPLIPQHMFRAFADVQITKKAFADLGLVAASSAYARGNENNQHEADGVYYVGPGRSPGYAVLNLGARYQIHSRVQLFVQINNLLDRQYYSAAQLGPAAFTAVDTVFTRAGSFMARPLPAVDGEFPLISTTFFAPGAPRGVWGGIRLRF
jgi:outer membrane receptor protein involved in Fe transport